MSLSLATLSHLSTLFLALALLQTFLKNPLSKILSPHWRFLSEPEWIFVFWATLFSICFFIFSDPTLFLNYYKNLSFTEPFFIFAIVFVASTKPCLDLAKQGLGYLSKKLRGKHPWIDPKKLDLFLVLSIGSLAGSLITEPAAITVCGLLIISMLDRPSAKYLHSLLAVLFVNISVGGALTSFAAPPILMVIAPWQWGLSDVFFHFGVKSILIVLINSFVFIWLYKNEVQKNKNLEISKNPQPLVFTFINLFFLILLILFVHNFLVLASAITVFIIYAYKTKPHQGRLRFKDSLGVGLFLGAIVILGSMQNWWLGPLLSRLSEELIYFISILLTSVVDNAALTYMGTQVQNLSDQSKYFLVAGALTGGGLTLIANAPNLIGFDILKSKFKNFSSWELLKAALLPTLTALIVFYFN